MFTAMVRTLGRRLLGLNESGPVIGIILLAACGSSPGPGLDASAADAGAVDVRYFADATVDACQPGVACGPIHCGQAELCLAVPTSSCAAQTSTTCAAPKEACQEGGARGCTAPRTRSCASLGPCTAAPSCACLAGVSLCPDGRTPDCLRRSDGITVECSFATRDAG